MRTIMVKAKADLPGIQNGKTYFARDKFKMTYEVYNDKQNLQQYPKTQFEEITEETKE